MSVKKIFLCLLIILLPLVFGDHSEKVLFAEEAAIDVTGEIEIETIQVLDLHSAQQIAIKDNPTIAAAEARVRQAKERMWQAEPRSIDRHVAAKHLIRKPFMVYLCHGPDHVAVRSQGDCPGRRQPGQARLPRSRRRGSRHARRPEGHGRGHRLL